MKSSTQPTLFLTPGRRRLLALLAVLVALTYLPLNRMMFGGITVEIPLDRLIPFYPVWMVPYLLSIAWWVFALVWAYVALDDALFVRFVTGWFIACAIGFSFFFFFPTYMVRPVVTGDDWASALVRHIYTNDRTYNAFPSMHLWTTTLITLVMSRWKQTWKWPLWGLTAIVGLSTLFSGQHWILDVFGGIGLALASYYLAPVLLRLLKSQWGTVPA